MEQIADNALSTKRMVAYHFNNKKLLYVEVLHQRVTVSLSRFLSQYFFPTGFN